MDAKIHDVTDETLPDDESRLSISDLLNVYRRRFKLIIVLVTLMSAMVFGATYLLPREYTATARIEVQSEGTQVVDTEAILERRALDSTIIETHIERIKSPDVMAHVLDALEIESNDQLAVALTSPDDRWSIVGNAVKILLSASGIAQAEQDPDDPETVRIPTRKELANTLMQKMAASQVGESYVIEVKYTAGRAEESALIANRIAKSYIALQFEAKKESTSKASGWLDDRLQELRATLRDSEQEVGAYREEKALIETRGVAYDVTQLATLNRDLIIALAELDERKARLALLQSGFKDREQLEAVPEVMASRVISDLRSQESRLEREEAQLRQEFGPNHPQIKLIEAQQKGLTDSLQREARNIAGVIAEEALQAEQRTALLSNQLNEAKQLITTNKKAEIQLGELERVAEANRVLYQSFLKRHKTLSEQQQALTPDSRIIANAEAPTIPSFPKLSMIIPIGFISSVLISSLIVLLVEGADTGIYSREQLRRTLKIDGLGMVPRLTGYKDPSAEKSLHRFLVESPQSDYAEAIRAARIAVLSGRSQEKVLLITSALPMEGKTTFSMSLGASIATAGKSVILVDLDLRHPSVRKRTSQDQGAVELLDYLSGKASLEEAIHIDENAGGLHILSNSSMPDNPADLIASAKVEDLIQELRDRYDIVLIDTPPVIGLTDTRIAGHYADNILLILRWGKTPIKAAKLALEGLALHRNKLIGGMLSQVDIKQHARGAYGDVYDYYHRYKKYYRT